MIPRDASDFVQFPYMDTMNYELNSVLDLNIMICINFMCLCLFCMCALEIFYEISL